MLRWPGFRSPSACFRFGPVSAAAASGGFRVSVSGVFCDWTARLFWPFLSSKSLSAAFLRRTWVLLRLWPFRASWGLWWPQTGFASVSGRFGWTSACPLAPRFPGACPSRPSGLGRFWRSGFRLSIFRPGFAWFSLKGFPADSGSGFGFFVFRFFVGRILAAVGLSASLAPRVSAWWAGASGSGAAGVSYPDGPALSLWLGVSGSWVLVSATGSWLRAPGAMPRLRPFLRLSGLLGRAWPLRLRFGPRRRRLSCLRPLRGFRPLAPLLWRFLR